MNQNTKWLAFVTPKTYSKFDKSKLPDYTNGDIEIIATVDIYMNMIDDDWTEEMCDDTCYIVERKYFESTNKNIFELKDY